MSPRVATKAESEHRIATAVRAFDVAARKLMAAPPPPPDPNRRPSELANLQDQEQLCREHIAALIKEREITGDAWASLRDATVITAQKRRSELKVELEALTALIAERKGHYRTHSDALLAHLREELRTIETHDVGPEYRAPIQALIYRAQRDREATLGES